MAESPITAELLASSPIHREQIRVLRNISIDEPFVPQRAHVLYETEYIAQCDEVFQRRVV